MNAASVKARLKNLAVKEGGTMQDKLVTYALERSIYRLSISKYANRFIIKGGIFLYALFDKQFARATFELDKNFQFLLEGEQIYPAWNKDTETWLKEAIGKLKNIADKKESVR